ncbi:MAG: RraA family protein [Halobacteriaceae archaeon]
MTRTSASDLCDRYEQLYTGVVADVLDEYGYEDQTMDRHIEPLDDQMVAAGVAFPAHGRANRSVDPDTQIRRFLEMLDDAPPESVLALHTRDTTSSHIGELSTLALLQRDCRGVVVHGGVRDTRFILEQEFPVFTRFKLPADSVPRWELIEWGEPTVVGGVAVAPGDVVLADVDGVVVVPEEVAEDVLSDAEEMTRTENEVRAAIRDGVAPPEAYDRYGTF